MSTSPPLCRNEMIEMLFCLEGTIDHKLFGRNVKVIKIEFQDMHLDVSLIKTKPYPHSYRDGWNSFNDSTMY